MSANTKDVNKDPCKVTPKSMDYYFDAEVAETESCKTCIEENMEPSVQDSICIYGVFAP